MKTKKISYEAIGEEYFFTKHPSGLDIYIYPKKGYSSKYAILGTNFGSVNNTFKLKNEEAFTIVPDGIAHYLEHKLFASESGDAFELFAKTGASANAYTSFEKTAYLFSCTDNFNQSLEILLDFVQTPYFTEENVEKERGIIAQEIKMYQDSPEWKVYINLLGALYHNHPVKIDIAGSVESIAKITPEILYDCYKAFYNLHNMALCIVGDLDPDEVLAVIDKKIQYSPPIEIDRYFPQEPKTVCKEFVNEEFDINSSMFCLGFKENVSSNVSTKDSVYTDLILSYLTSPSSEMYSELLGSGLINTASFTGEHLEGPKYSSIVFSGESQNPEKAAEVIKKHTAKLLSSGIKKEDFERIKKAVYGKSMNVYNSVSSTANVLLGFVLSGKDFFGYMKELENATLEGLNERIAAHFKEDNSSLSVAVPKRK